MRFLSVTLDPEWHACRHIGIRRGLAAARIAVDCYISDVKKNIAALVQDMIDAGLASHNHSDVEVARDRRRSLRTWLRSEYPLGYGDHSYPALLHAITPNGSPPSMPFGNPQSMSTREVGQAIYSMMRPDSPTPLVAPLFTKSPHTRVFRVAIQYMLTQAKVAKIDDHPTFVESAITQILNESQVSHVPWSSPPAVNASGKAGRKVNFVYWRGTSKDVQMGELALMQIVDTGTQAQLRDVHLARSASLQDAAAPWTIHSLTIGQLPSILHKRTLPSDFNLKDASLQPNDGYISETYSFVMEHYDGASPIHRFALLVAHMFSRVTPNLKHPDVAPAMTSARPSTAKLTAEVRRSPWLHDTRKGLTVPEPFIVMVTTYIIAFLYDDSPLLKQMNVDKRKGLGLWGKKHSQSITIYLSVPRFLTSLLQQVTNGSPASTLLAWGSPTPIAYLYMALQSTDRLTPGR